MLCITCAQSVFLIEWIENRYKSEGNLHKGVIKRVSIHNCNFHLDTSLMELGVSLATTSPGASWSLLIVLNGLFFSHYIAKGQRARGVLI